MIRIKSKPWNAPLTTSELEEKTTGKKLQHTPVGRAIICIHCGKGTPSLEHFDSQTYIHPACRVARLKAGK